MIIHPPPGFSVYHDEQDEEYVMIVCDRCILQWNTEFDRHFPDGTAKSSEKQRTTARALANSAFPGAKGDLVTAQAPLKIIAQDHNSLYHMV